MYVLGASTILLKAFFFEAALLLKAKKVSGAIVQ
jgi:hypothetical protein